jgi:hypothetical protein
VSNLILLFAAAVMVIAAIYMGHQGLRLARINKMLEVIVKSLESKK